MGLGGDKEIGVRFQQRSVTRPNARKEGRICTIANRKNSHKPPLSAKLLVVDL